MDDIEAALAGLDDPRPLPSSARAALAAAIAVAVGAPEQLLVGLDAPTELPAGARSRMRGVIAAEVEGRSGVDEPARRRHYVEIAAALVLLAGLLAAFVHGGSQAARSVASRPVGPAANSPRAGSASGSFAGSAPLAAPSPAAGAGAGAGGATSAQGATGSASGGASSPAGASSAAPGTPSSPGVGPGSGPPPYAFPSGAAPTPAGAPNGSGQLRIGVISGDALEQAGFNAYIDQLNASGGVRGRSVEAVAVSPASPAHDVVATVNLSSTAVATASGAPAWVGAPLVETLAVPNSALSGAVFDFASAPVHQARLAVAAVFPSSAPGRSAVIYREAQGIFASEIPNAIASALQARGVAAVMVTYSPGAQLATPPGDAAFLSLDRTSVQAWFAAAGRAGYRPALGVAGLFSAAEPSLATSMPDGTRVLAPYDLPSSAERSALASAIGTQPGMAAVQGWVAAKTLAVALWESGATTAAGATSALRNLAGYADGWSPPLSFRPGTTSRTPDAELFTVQHGALVGSGRFSTDPQG